MPTVPMTPTRPVSVTCRAARMPGAITPMTGMSTRCCSCVERGRGRAVARDHEHLDAPVEQAIRDLERVLAHLFGGLRAVREAPGVAEVHDVLVGEQIDQRPHDGQAAEAAVEHTDRTPVARHRAATLLRLRGRIGGRPLQSIDDGDAQSVGRRRDRQHDIESCAVGFAQSRVENTGVFVDVARCARAPRRRPEPPARQRARARRPRAPAVTNVTGAIVDVDRRDDLDAGVGARSARAGCPAPRPHRCRGARRRDRRPRARSRASIAPTRRTAGSAVVTSTIVDSTPTRLAPPSSTKSTSAPRSARTCAALVGLTRPKRLADGAAMPPAKCPSSASATGWSGTRRPTVGASTGRRVRDHVRALAEHQRQRPGPERGGQRARDVGDVARVVVERCAGRDVHDHRMVERSPLHAVEPVQRLGIRRVGTEPVHGLGRERDQAAAPQHGDGGVDVGDRIRHQ